MGRTSRCPFRARAPQAPSPVRAVPLRGPCRERCHGNGVTAVTGSEWGQRPREHGGGPGAHGRRRRRGGSVSSSRRGGSLGSSRRGAALSQVREGRTEGRPGRGAGGGSGAGVPQLPWPRRMVLARRALSQPPPVCPQAWSPRCRTAGSRGDGGERLSLSAEAFRVCETCTVPETSVSVLLLLLHLEE